MTEQKIERIIERAFFTAREEELDLGEVETLLLEEVRSHYEEEDDIAGLCE